MTENRYSEGSVGAYNIRTIAVADRGSTLERINLNLGVYPVAICRNIFSNVPLLFRSPARTFPQSHALELALFGGWLFSDTVDYKCWGVVYFAQRAPGAVDDQRIKEGTRTVFSRMQVKRWEKDLTKVSDYGLSCCLDTAEERRRTVRKMHVKGELGKWRCSICVLRRNSWFA